MMATAAEAVFPSPTSASTALVFTRVHAFSNKPHNTCPRNHPSLQQQFSAGTAHWDVLLLVGEPPRDDVLHSVERNKGQVK